MTHSTTEQDRELSGWQRSVLHFYYASIYRRHGLAALLRSIRRIHQWIARDRKMPLIERRYLTLIESLDSAALAKGEK